MSAAAAEDLTSHDWAAHALCAKMDIDNASTADRLELCGYCPVKQQCLATALADKSLVGVWGGTTDSERRLLRKGFDTAPAPPVKVMERRARDERIRELSARGAPNSEIAAAYRIDIRTVRRILARTPTHTD